MKNKNLKKIYNEFSKKQKLIKDIKKLQKLNEKVEKGIDIRKPKPKKIKTFDEYFQECIRDKKIPPPPILLLIFVKLLRELLGNMNKDL